MSVSKRLIINVALFLAVASGSILTGCRSEKEPVDYVNPYIGNISHLLVPTYPTVHLPNSMLRVYPRREDFTGNKLNGLPVVVSRHRGYSPFSIYPFQGGNAPEYIDYEYDNEKVTPYLYQVCLQNIGADVRFAPSHQSAIYEIQFGGDGTLQLVVKSNNGSLTVDGNAVSGYEQLGEYATKAYIYLEVDQPVVSQEVNTQGQSASASLKFADNVKKLNVRYGISYIDEAQAKKNLKREIASSDLDAVAEKGRQVWNEALGKIEVQGSSEEDKTIFYTSFYRFYERMICMSEDGRYYSGFDGKVHNDEGIPFYTDDWLWDTYRAAHPLRTIIEPEKESHMVNSYIRMSEQMEDYWMPTFPEVVGDVRGMNSNHGVAVVADCYAKGVRGFDLEKAYRACKGAITEKTLAPWSAKRKGELDEFFVQEGYFPALATGEEETVPEVHPFERRQPVSVTLGTVYDEWCLAQVANALGKEDEYRYFMDRSLNYKKIFHPETKFFHPKDKYGQFVQPFDYRYSGGQGARGAYAENNGWIYRWDVPHNVGDLIQMMGGNDAFVSEMERMYSTPLGRSKYDFFAQIPDHTGNVGQFSMANEPCLHIPYLYNYAGQPWRTQKRIRTLLTQWFRNDLMGVPGDEDGGGMTSFVVFSYLGFYPVTPGMPVYVIGSPVFEQATVHLEDGKRFEVVCHNYSPENKYIQSAKLNGKEWNRSWFTHDDLAKGGKLEFVMGDRPNKQWASSADAVPPSFEWNKHNN